MNEDHADFYIGDKRYGVNGWGGLSGRVQGGDWFMLLFILCESQVNESSLRFPFMVAFLYHSFSFFPLEKKC